MYLAELYAHDVFGGSTCLWWLATGASIHMYGAGLPVSSWFKVSFIACDISLLYAACPGGCNDLSTSSGGTQITSHGRMRNTSGESRLQRCGVGYCRLEMRMWVVNNVVRFGVRGRDTSTPQLW